MRRKPLQRRNRSSSANLKRCSALGALAIAALLLPGNHALAHPHVYVEANIEVLRNDEGLATELRQVWRFDELFSSTVVLDFDADGDGALSIPELEEIAKTVKQNISEYNFYTEIRQGNEIVNFYEPDPFLVDYDDGRVIMIMALELEKPQQMTGANFRVAVSDPTYYVAMEIPGDEAITVNGGDKCTHEVVVPDWDALYKEDAERMAKLFSAAPDEKVEASDDYLTWINFTCGS